MQPVPMVYQVPQQQQQPYPVYPGQGPQTQGLQGGTPNSDVLKRVKRTMVRPMNDSGSHWGVHRLLSTGTNCPLSVMIPFLVGCLLLCITAPGVIEASNLNWSRTNIRLYSQHYQGPK